MNDKDPKANLDSRSVDPLRESVGRLAALVVISTDVVDSVLDALAHEDRRRAVVAYPKLRVLPVGEGRVLPVGDGIDLGELGHYSIVGAKQIRRSNYQDVLRGEALFEVVLEGD